MSLSRIAPALVLCAACTSSTDMPSQPDLQSSLPDLAAPADRAVSLRFAAKFASKPLDCAGSYEGVGTGKQHIHPGDARLYVHSVRLVDDKGAEVPVKLTPDNTWQSAEVALLDFTNGSDECTDTPETNTVIKGTIPGSATTIAGLRFLVGVPFAQNHKDVTTAKAPLSHSDLFWTWNSGYKFFVVEGKNHDGKAFLLHLGSTGCVKDAMNNVTSCSAPNRTAVSLTGFDPDKSTVVLDLAEVLSGSNLDNEVACHSSPAQPDCAPLFARMGLPLSGVEPMPLAAFRVE